MLSTADTIGMKTPVNGEIGSVTLGSIGYGLIVGVIGDWIGVGVVA